MVHPEQLSPIRLNERATARFYINKIDRERGDVAFVARVKDISESGMYLYKLLEPTLDAEAAEKEQRAFNVEMQLPGHEEVIWAEVEVVREDATRRRAEGYAVRFSRIAETDRRLIGDFVRSQTHH